MNIVSQTKPSIQCFRVFKISKHTVNKFTGSVYYLFYAQFKPTTTEGFLRAIGHVDIL